MDDQEFYQLFDKEGVTDDIHQFNEKLREWEDYYKVPSSARGARRPNSVRTARAQRELECQRSLRTLQVAASGRYWTRTSDLVRVKHAL